MAYLPCHQGLHRHPGRNVNVYMAMLGGDLTERASFRLCLEHWRLLEHDLAEFEVDPTDDAAGSFRPSTKCVADLKPVDESGGQLFVTAYPAKNERKDYWGKLHDGCRLPWVFDPQLTWAQTP